MRRLTLVLAATALVFAASSAQAAVQITAGSTNGIYSNNECGGQGGFPNCYATQSGVVQGPTTDPLASSAIYKLNSDGTQAFSTVFPTISGSEFVVNLANQMLTFTYTAGTGDPIVHYYAVSQANSYVLFYDPNPITSGSINLSTYFSNQGYSHITFFDTTNRGPVPEPATWAMMLLGFGGIGMALRRRNRRVAALVQTA